MAYRRQEFLHRHRDTGHPFTHQPLLVDPSLINRENRGLEEAAVHRANAEVFDAVVFVEERKEGRINQSGIGCRQGIEPDSEPAIDEREVSNRQGILQVGCYGDGNPLRLKGVYIIGFPMIVGGIKGQVTVNFIDISEDGILGCLIIVDKPGQELLDIEGIDEACPITGETGLVDGYARFRIGDFRFRDFARTMGRRRKKARNRKQGGSGKYQDGSRIQ